MKQIELLDCTLRDGGHLNNSYFGKDVIVDIINKLLESKIDIIEVGFLKNCEFDENVACYNNIQEAKKILPEKPDNVQYSLMAQEDLYDISKLEYCDGTVEIIRVSFHDFDLWEGLQFAKKIVDKGYKCYINPINTLGYTDEELLHIINRVNEIHPEGFTIVDTFGSLTKNDLLRMYYLIDNNLLPDIKIAIHLHENQSMSYSLAQTMIEICSVRRNICIDGSLYGMGRVPGNLCIELIMDYMNQVIGSDYNIEPVYDAIDDYILDIKSKNPWGYSSAYALSGQHRLHRTYAEYLLAKGKLRTKQINQILSMITAEHKTKFDQEYIENIYREYQNKSVDDTKDIEKLQNEVKGKDVLLLASGKSINLYWKDIMQIKEKVDLSFAAGFQWEKMKCDYMFSSNVKRWDLFGRKTDMKKIITSNLKDTDISYDYIVNYADYAYSINKLFDNNGIMLIKLVLKLGAANIYLAGFDGFSNEDNFVLPQKEYGYHEERKKEQQMIRQIIEFLNINNQIHFVTPSAYNSDE